MEASVFFVFLFIGAINGKEYTFDSSLEDWNAYRGAWRWGDRATENTTFPGAKDGFALMSATDGSDELYLQFVNLTYGGSITVTFFGRSPAKTANNLYLQKAYTNVLDAVTIHDYSAYLTPIANQWVTVTVQIEPDSLAVFLGFFCFNSGTASAGQYFQGCAIDSISLNYNDATTTISQTTSSSKPTTNPTATTTNQPLTTTPVYTTTPPLTTEKQPSTTTTTTLSTKATTSVTTTTNPTTTQPITSSFPTKISTPLTSTTTRQSTTLLASTTNYPSGSYSYDFQNGTEGWTLSHINGASWKWVELQNNSISVGIPPAGPWVLQVFPEDIYTGIVLAQSPLYRALSDRLEVSITCWLQGTTDIPVQLKVRRRISYTKFDKNPIINMDSFGSQSNSKWIQYSGVLNGLTIGEEFSLNLEGGLGADSKNNVIVSSITVWGVIEVPTNDSYYYDFESGLTGWSTGNMDGGNWARKQWTQGGELLGIPKPADGDNFLFVDRFNIHSGTVSIESPQFTMIPETAYQFSLKFWTRGTIFYPAIIRLRLKTVEGEYEDLPFLNLQKYGDVNLPDWVAINKTYEVSLPSGPQNYQLVIEADLGADADNLVAVDDVQIITA